MVANDKIRIAIIGGGIAGSTVANALIKHPHVSVHVYESAPQFSERGAGIGLSHLALSALDEIVPSASLRLKTEAGAVTVGPARIVLGSGPNAGTVVSDIDEDSGLAMNRSPLLKTLLSPLSTEILHPNKGLSSLDQIGDSVHLTFDDGSTDIFDAVIGADGLFSCVREYVLDGEFEGSPAGWWDCRNLVSAEKAKSILGTESFELDREYCWAGEGAFMMHAVVENGTKVQCIISAVEKDFPKDRKRSITREGLEDLFKNGWEKNLAANGMMELILDQSDPQAYSMWEHKSTPTYARGRVCIVGDAAHTTTPWQGAGAGLAVEDALILGHLMGNVTRANQLEKAFRVFDLVRRPRCQRVIDTSRACGRLWCGQDEDVGLDVVKMGEKIGSLYGDLDALDLGNHKRDAAEQFMAMAD